MELSTDKVVLNSEIGIIPELRKEEEKSTPHEIHSGAMNLESPLTDLPSATEPSQQNLSIEPPTLEMHEFTAATALHMTKDLSKITEKNESTNTQS